MTQFGRAARLTVSSPKNGDFFGPDTNSLVVSNLRIRFHIEKHLKSEPNPAQIIVYQLAEPVRSRLQHKPLRIQLDAGYENRLDRIFVGDLRFGNNIPQNPGWQTVIEAADGGRALRQARVNKSFRPGTKVGQAVREIAKALGLKIRQGSLDLNSLNRQFTTGTAIYGPARKELARVLGPEGVDWTIQDGELLIIRSEEALGNAILVNAETGLVGSPEFGTPTTNKRKPVLSIKTKLRGDIAPGKLLQVESKAITGVFKAQRCVYEGDTRSTNWYTLIEALAV